MVCHATTCRMARNPSRVAVKRREVGGLQGEAFSALDLSEIGCVESHPTRISGRSSVDPAPRRCHCHHFQGENRHFQGRRRRNFHTRQIRKSLGGFSKISRHANRNKITVSTYLSAFLFSCLKKPGASIIFPLNPETGHVNPQRCQNQPGRTANSPDICCG